MFEKPTYEDLEQRVRELEKADYERKQAEEELHVNLTKYKALFEALPLGITISDRTGNILESNIMAEQLLGISRDEQTKRKIDDREWLIIRPDGSPMAADEYASVRALKEERLVENIVMGIVKGESDIIWINATATPIPLEGYGVIIVYNDITERKRAEEALRESEKRFHRLFEDDLTGDFLCTPEGKIILCNPAFATIFGFSSPRGSGRHEYVQALYPTRRTRFNVGGA